MNQAYDRAAEQGPNSLSGGQAGRRGAALHRRGPGGPETAWVHRLGGPRWQGPEREPAVRVDRHVLDIALEELGRIEVAIAQTRGTLAKATDKVLRTEIRSPIDGIVKNLRYHTIGGIVRPCTGPRDVGPDPCLLARREETG